MKMLRALAAAAVVVLAVAGSPQGAEAAASARSRLQMQLQARSREEPAPQPTSTDMPAAKEKGPVEEVPLTGEEKAAADAVVDQTTKPAAAAAAAGAAAAAPAAAEGSGLPPAVAKEAAAAEGAVLRELAVKAAASSSNSTEALPSALADWLKPSYGQGLGRLLSVSVPEGQSPVDAEKYRIAALRRRLDDVNSRLRATQEATDKAVADVDALFAKLEKDGNAVHDAYVKHEVAAKGADLTHFTGSNSTLEALIGASRSLVSSQEAHFTATTELMAELPLLYDQQVALDNDRLRLERAITTLEVQLARSISKSAAAGQEKVVDPKSVPTS